MQYRLLSAIPSELRLELLPHTTQQSLQPLHLSVTMTTENHFRLQVKLLLFFFVCFLLFFICVGFVTPNTREKVLFVSSDPGVSGHCRPYRGVNGRDCKRAECCTVGSDGVLH